MENLTDCPLPPRRFRSKWEKLLFSLYDSYIVYALAVIVLTMCYTAIFAIHHREKLSLNELNMQTTATIIDFKLSEYNDNKGGTYLSYDYTLAYNHGGRTLEKYIQVDKKDIKTELPTEVGGELVVYFHSKKPYIISLFPQAKPIPLPLLNILGILIFSIVPTLVIQNRRAKRLALLPILEMGLPTYAEIAKKNISALNSAKSTVKYPLEFVAFDGETYKTNLSAAARNFDNKSILLLYNLSNPNEYIAPNTIESPPKFNDDGSLSPYFGHSMQNALRLAAALSFVALCIYLSN